MRIRDEDRRAFRRVGTVMWDSARRNLQWSWDPNVPSGFVVYLMVVDDEVKKAGKAEDTKSSTYKKRMQGEFGAVRQVICGPRPGRTLAKWRLKRFDPFKKHAPPVLLAGRTVELWAKVVDDQPSMLKEEIRLLEKYRGEWTDEGWMRDGQRRWAEGDAD